MGFRINTNVAAMNAHRNSVNTNLGLDKSLNSLSSGLRINKAADDASGMTIADSLRSQAQGLGQAINNANDGVAVVQTADGALDEYINIINTVRAKSIQAASDGQNSSSREAIQADIDRLLEAADGIATQTQFNGQKLLDGTFTNKAFHIGAYAAETSNLSVDSVRTNAVGDIKSMETALTRTVALDDTNTTETEDGYQLNANSLSVNGFDLSASINENNPTRLTDAKSVAAAIMDQTGIMAQAETIVSGDTIVGGAIGGAQTLTINGVGIADTTVLAGDSDGALAQAINDIASQTGVTAKTVDGALVLTAKDGGNISIGGGSGAQVSEMTLSGTVETGDVFSVEIDGSGTPNSVTATEGETLEEVATRLAKAINSGADNTTVTATTDGAKLILTAVNELTDDQFIAVGTTTNAAKTDDQGFNAAPVAATAGADGVSQKSTIYFSDGATAANEQTGDVYSLVLNGTTYTAGALTSADTATLAVADLVSQLEAAGAAVTGKFQFTVTGGTNIAIEAKDAGEAFTSAAHVVDASADATDPAIAFSVVSVPSSPGIAAEDVFTFDDKNAKLDEGDVHTIKTDWGAASYTVVAGDTVDDITDSLMTQLNAISTAYPTSFTASLTDTGEITLKEAISDGDPHDATKWNNESFYADASGDDTQAISATVLDTPASSATGYSITGLTDKLTDQTSSSAITELGAGQTGTFTVTQGELVINGTDMAGVYGDGVVAGSAAEAFIAKVQEISGMEDSTLLNGNLTLIVNDGQDLNISGVSVDSKFNLTEGVFNESATGRVNIYSNEDIVIAGDSAGAFGFETGNFKTTAEGMSLENIDVTTRDSAELAILIADSALKQLDATRSDLGSVQNQLESTIRNISVTQVNVTSAESQIRDVDFAAESANFAKLNILAQSGSYAMSQANAVQQNVMRLLQ